MRYPPISNSGRLFDYANLPGTQYERAAFSHWLSNAPPNPRYTRNVYRARRTLASAVYRRRYQQRLRTLQVRSLLRRRLPSELVQQIAPIRRRRLY